MYADTIVAIATPPGFGALGIVRLTGSEALSFAQACVRTPTSLAELKSHRCTVGEVYDGESLLDQVVVTIFRSPHTYTGEDVVEITCHGGQYLASRLVELLRAQGARPAREGEFTLRAYLNGRMDLAQAEAVAALIEARSAAGARAAMRILSGGLGTALDDVLTDLTHLLAEIESTLDIEEDGAPDVLAPVPADEGRPAQAERLARAHDRLHQLAHGGRAGRMLEEGAHVAIVGRPNAGKSSLFNAFLARERAIVSSEAGTTRDALEGWVEWDGLPISLHDTAGLQAPRSEVEAAGQLRTREAAEAAAVLILVLDATREGLEDLHAQLTELKVFLAKGEPAGGASSSPKSLTRAGGIPILVALHKWDAGPLAQWRSDQLDVSDLAEMKGFFEVSAIRSSVVGEPGPGALRTAVLEALERGAGDPRETLIVGDRQRGLMEQAARRLEEARGAMQAGEGDELVAHEIRRALDALGELLGRNVASAVLDEIFSRFCVGK